MAITQIAIDKSLIDDRERKRDREGEREKDGEREREMEKERERERMFLIPKHCRGLNWSPVLT